MIHNNNHFNIICNLSPFMSSANNINNSAIIIDKKNNINNKNNKFFYNKKEDFLLHCVNISLNNESNECHHNIIKNNSIELAKNDVNGLMKKYKIFTSKNFINTIFSCNKITPELFFMLNILNNITIIIIKGNKVYYFGDNNNNVTGYIIADTYKYFTKDYEFNSETYYNIFTPFKPLNCASSYKIADLYNIAKLLDIPIIIDNKNRLKKDIYEHIKSDLTFEF